ncbi:MAG: hypothetical protein AAGA85_10985 [Bacteroidota bacterium]
MQPRLSFTLLLFLVGLSAFSQEFKFIRAEAYYGYGYTGFDIDEWVGSTLFEWDQANYGGHAQVFFFEFGPLDAGLQIGYQTLFWYETRRDAGFTTPIFRQFSPGATQIMLVGQVGPDTGWFGEFGLGGYTGETISGAALSGAGGYRFGLPSGFGIPIKARVDALFAEQTFAVTTLFVGVSYQLDR